MNFLLGAAWACRWECRGKCGDLGACESLVLLYLEANCLHTCEAGAVVTSRDIPIKPMLMCDPRI